MIKIFKKEKKEPENFEELISHFKKLEETQKKLLEEFENLKKESQFCIQKVGIIRFNPFKEVGGDQSFSVALLDKNDSGVVITSHYSREGNRVYGKPVDKGQSKYLLSKEEKEVINKAQEIKNETENSTKLNPPAVD